VPPVRDLLFRESTTLGVRASRVSRWALSREHVAVTTEFGEVRIKLGRLRGELVNAHPEFEDCRARAQAANVPVKRVFAAALAAFWGREGRASDPG
jgi:pyridinium-3,5-bisthiocarboxylic acid mononucleotide nickel chelatase